MEQRNTRARLAPAPRAIADPNTLLQRLEVTLRTDYELAMLMPFTVIVEGTTDVDYLQKAVESVQASTGVDLLDVPSSLGGSDRQRIGICTPGRPGAPTRGGVPQMVRLARTLQPYVFTLEAFLGIVFVFDHDDAGIEAQQEIAGFGFKPGQHSFTIDPKQHPSCGQKQVVIEDLLSLNIQREFFDRGGAWCSAEYEEGQLIRFKWGHQSKPLLRDYVCAKGAIDDLSGPISVLKRVRSTFGLPD